MALGKIIWTNTAARQRRFILQYWVRTTGSPDYSVKLLSQLRERLEHVKGHPLLGQKADYPETRMISMGHYSIYYKLSTDTIVVTAFWDNRQDPGKLLKILS